MSSMPRLVEYVRTTDKALSPPTGVQMDFNVDLLRTMLINVNDRISIIDANYKIVCTSPAVAKVWKLDIEEIVGLTLADLVGQENFNNDLKHHVDLALSGTASYHNFWQSSSVRYRQHTDARYLDYRCKPWTVNGRIAGAIINVQDLTDIHRAEKNLAQTQQRLTDYANSTSDWCWEMDSDLRFSWLSSQIETLFHLDRQSLYGKPRRGSPETDAEIQSWHEHQKQLALREPFRDFRYKVKTRRGVRWASTSGVPVYDQVGQFAGYRGTASDVTDLKEIEFQAQQIERRFTHAIDEYPGSFALYDNQEQLLAYNRNFEEIHSFLGSELKPGLSFERCQTILLDAGLNEQAIGREKEWLAARLEQFRNPGESTECLINNKTWYRITEQRLPDGGCLQTMVDITTDKNTELAIKEERNLLRSLIDNIPDFIYAKDNQAQFTVQNRALNDFMRLQLDPSGASDLAIEGTTDFDYFEYEEAVEFNKVDFRVIQRGESFYDQQRHLRSPVDGETMWVSTSKVPLRDTEGNIIGLVGSGRNISTHKKLEAELRSSQERFRDFAETAADLFWELDADLKINYVSRRCKELTGFSAEFLVGKDFRSINSREHKYPAMTDDIENSIDRRIAFDNLEIIVGKRRSPTHLLLSGKPTYNAAGEFLGYRGAGRDITKSRQLEDLLSHQVSHDELTDLPNRREFEHRLENALEQTVAEGMSSVLGYLDLDQFKLINDTVGHLAGDQLLIQVARLIAEQLRKQDTLARLGGDEFGLLFVDCTITEAVAAMERTIRQFEAFRFTWDDQIFGVGASIGLVAIDSSELSETELLSRADLACFAAKDNGRGRVHIYRPDDRELASRHSDLLLAGGIKEALKENRFCLYSQPIAALSAGNTAKTSLVVEHHEILLRMRGKKNELLAPGAFIPAAERFGLMNEVDRWVISNTFQALNRAMGSERSLHITINLSGQSLSDNSLAEFVKQQLTRYSINPSTVCFEITETAAISNFKQAQVFISVMKNLGCAFALDDFGSGLSSFNYLKHFAVDYLKIDGSFVRDIVDNPTDQVMVSSIHQIGQLLGIKTIAEFVENDAIIEMLQTIGVDFVQGYGVGKPIEFSQCLQQITELETPPACVVEEAVERDGCLA